MQTLCAETWYLHQLKQHDSLANAFLLWYSRTEFNLSLNLRTSDMTDNDDMNMRSETCYH